MSGMTLSLTVFTVATRMPNTLSISSESPEDVRSLFRLLNEERSAKIF